MTDATEDNDNYFFREKTKHNGDDDASLPAISTLHSTAYMYSAPIILQ